MPKKIDYVAGDSFDITGLEVTGVYENNVYVVVTGACNIIVNEPLTAQDTSVLISYEGFEAKIGIKVYDEAHTCWRTMFTIDGYTNTERTFINNCIILAFIIIL